MRKSNLVMKIFLILFGIIIILGGVIIINSITTSACMPTELFGEVGSVGFGGAFVNTLYDSLCNNVLNLNSAIWNFYSNQAVGWLGQEGTVERIGRAAWDMGGVFCKKHSNFDYATGETAGAITSTENFKDLFVYEVERCWTMFEGIRTNPKDDRHPLGKQAMFDCGEIIYDFTQSNSVSLAELYARLSSTNYCGEDVNAPVEYVDNPDGSQSLIEYMMWCAPLDEMAAYWFWNNYYMSPESFQFSASSVDELTCTYPDPNQDLPEDEQEVMDRLQHPTTACIPYTQALCSFALGMPWEYGLNVEDIDPYDLVEEEWFDESSYPLGSGDFSTIIDGCGKVTITYYDYFDWGSLFNKQETMDNYKACNYVEVFNNFDTLEVWDSSSNTYYKRYDDNSDEYYEIKEKNGILICYERYDTNAEGECEWS